MNNDRISATRLAVVLVLLSAAFLLLPALGSAQTAPEPQPEQVVGSPDIELVATEDRLHPGETQTVTLQVTNSGDIRRAGSTALEQRVTTARNLRFEVREDRLPDGMELRSGPVVAGSLPEGVGEPIQFTFDVDEDIEAGVHEIQIRTRYDFTRLAERTAGGTTSYRDFSRDRTKRVSFVVEDDSRFSVESVRSGVIAGDTGDFAVEVENIGNMEARNARLVLSSGESGVFFGGMQDRLPQKTVGFDDLAPGESTVVTVRAGADSDVTPGSYPIDATVRYDTPRGVTRESRSVTATLTVGDEQEFVTENVESTLRVGDDGNLRGEIRNEGPQAVSNAVVVFNPESRNINPRETEYAVGDLGVGESEEFSYRVAVSSEAEEGPRRSDAFVEFRNPDGDRRTSSAVDVNYGVAERIDEFDVESDISLAEGTSRAIEVDITNIRDETLTDIQAKVFTDSPLDSDDDEAFVSSLEPGETETLIFDLSASSGATAKSYSFSMDFRYDDERGDTKISETYRVPVQVTEREEDSNVVVLLALALVILLVLLAWWRRGSVKSALGNSDSGD